MESSCTHVDFGFLCGSFPDESVDEISNEADEHRSEDEWNDSAGDEGLERGEADDGGIDAVSDGDAALEQHDVVLERDEEDCDERESYDSVESAEDAANLQCEP